MELTHVAVIGLGIIGSRALENLRKTDRAAKGWSRSAKGLEGETSSIEEALADAEVVSLYLKDAPAVRETVGKMAGIAGRNRLLLNHATVDLETTHWLADWCLNHGWRFLDAPFTGSKVAAEQAQLVYYIGGDDALLKEAEPLLMRTGRAVLPCGPVGAATTVKLATNLISACTIQAVSEALAISNRNGVSTELFAKAVSENACASALTGMKLASITEQDYTTHFSLSNMAKDGRYALALAQSVELETPAIAAVSAQMNQLCEQGLGDLDYSALAKPYQSER